MRSFLQKKTYKTEQVNPGHVSGKNVISQFSTISFLSPARTHPNKQLKITKISKTFSCQWQVVLNHHASSNEYSSGVKLRTPTETNILVNRFSLYTLQMNPYSQGCFYFVSLFLELWSLRDARVFFHDFLN